MRAVAAFADAQPLEPTAQLGISFLSLRETILQRLKEWLCIGLAVFSVEFSV
jgi:hypothetical protein